ncbi:transcription factor [Dorcoceras hygrometricum]|uniref:Transcription factor n=1 Tax=Dorcoceras hygrometricum TaxID=472368 RepID=A0A2Z7BNG9_9LAMI|nr:transcription factor [Dorcoceras hygrometricum]
MSNVEQEADNSKRNSEESDVVLKNQQTVRVQQMDTVEWIQQKRKDKDSADDIRRKEELKPFNGGRSTPLLSAYKYPIEIAGIPHHFEIHSNINPQTSRESLVEVLCKLRSSRYET